MGLELAEVDIKTSLLPVRLKSNKEFSEIFADAPGWKFPHMSPS
jgi:hypothetical protein